jgi:starvation-inducible outer membrane lipoprotein
MQRSPFSHLSLVLAAAISLSGCRPANIHDAEIEAVDYAYRAPAVVDPGLVAFHFTNHGKVAHEVQIFRFRQGTTVELANRYLQTGSVPDSAADASGSVLIANPGLTAPERILVQAVPGELYALMCQFRDSTGKPQHASLGMVALVRVGNDIH